MVDTGRNIFIAWTKPSGTESIRIIYRTMLMFENIVNKLFLLMYVVYIIHFIYIV